MKLYRYSPIENETQAKEALEYIHRKLLELRDGTVGEKWPVYTLKLFAHYKHEHDFLMKWINSTGVKDNSSSETSYYVKPHKPYVINDHEIAYIGLRTPDPYRSQVGCGDFEISNFTEVKEKYLGKAEGLREIKHPKYRMLELFDPDTDVLGYIVKK